MARKNDPTAPSGILIIDKPTGMTSHDVVAKIRRLARTRKVGHAGTLDPMATGVLVIGLGKATRLLTWITGNDKAYDATVRFGATTTTEDFEGTLTSAKGCVNLTEDSLEEAMIPLRGDILQVPSSVSAIKIDGKRAHALVRAGIEVDIPARPVTVLALERTSAIRSTTQHLDEDTAATLGVSSSLAVCDVDVHAEVSSGTYIRALARDMGEALGVGAHLRALRRTRVGAFSLSAARPLADLEELVADHEEIAPRDAQGRTPRPELPIMCIDNAVSTMFHTITLDEKETTHFSHGQAPHRSAQEIAELKSTVGSDPIGVLAADGMSAMGLIRVQDNKLVTVLVFP